MELYFALMGIGSLAYFFLLLIYNGPTSFLWFWPLVSLIHFLLWGLVQYCRHKKKKKQELPLPAVVFAFASYAFGLLILLTTLTVIFYHSRSREERNLDYVIVMGTELKNNRISDSLKARLDRALLYHEENPGTIFVLSGGHSAYNTSTEAGVMYFYMIQHGVSSKKLLMEVYSKSTQEKVGFSIQSIRVDRRDSLSPQARYEKGRGTEDTDSVSPAKNQREVISAGERPLRIGILTSDFNLFRAMHMAERYGIREAYPMGTGTDPLLFLHLSVREAVAILKDRMLGNM